VRGKQQRSAPSKSLTFSIHGANSNTRSHAWTQSDRPSRRSGDRRKDSDELKLRKTLLMFASGLMNIAAILWLLIYWWMGLKLPTSIPLGFQVISAVILAIYLRTRNFDFFRVAQLSLFLFFPFIIQWSIGSFVSSSGIALLALLAPVGAIVVYGPRESVPWFVAYVVFTVLSGVFDFFLARGDEFGIPMKTVAVFFVMNFTIISTMVYLLLRHFIQERDRFEGRLAEQHQLVRVEREKSEKLLLSILPGHVAERLKHQPGNIADGFPDVCVMFADMVNFTRLAEELTPNQVVSFLDEVFTRFDLLTQITAWTRSRPSATLTWWSAAWQTTG
jgi:hypothetical protein